MIPNPKLNSLNLKIVCIRLTMWGIETGDLNIDQRNRLGPILKIYEAYLIREKRQLPTSSIDQIRISETIRECVRLLKRLWTDRPISMCDWYHGIAPRNQEQALANLLSRILIDLGDVEGRYEFAHSANLNLEATSHRTKHYHPYRINRRCRLNKRRELCPSKN